MNASFEGVGFTSQPNPTAQAPLLHTPPGPAMAASVSSQPSMGVPPVPQVPRPLPPMPVRPLIQPPVGLPPSGFPTARPGQPSGSMPAQGQAVTGVSAPSQASLPESGQQQPGLAPQNIRATATGVSMAPRVAPIPMGNFRQASSSFMQPTFSMMGVMRPASAPMPAQFFQHFQAGGAFPPGSYMSSPGTQPLQMMPPGVLGSASAGMSRFPAPSFSPMGRPPTFTPRPPMGSPVVLPIPLQRPPVGGMRLIPPILKPPPGVAPVDATTKTSASVVVTSEKPHTTVYVGKIASTVEDDFLRPLLELCGPIRSWKRAQDPTTGSPKGFGFCEFDTAEGVLRALRILNKYSLDGQELVLNVNQATRDYLERYVKLKKERELQLKEKVQEDDKEEELAPGVEKVPEKSPHDQSNKESVATVDTEADDNGKKFGVVNDADRQADEAAFEKLNSMMEERARTKPLPPPPALPSTSELAGRSSSALDGSVRSRDEDSNFDEARSGDPVGKNEDEMTSENKSGLDLERPGTSGSERGRRTERDRERDREREMEREKERELERFERERERERSRRERDREARLREAERLYEEREREWEAREREKERQRLHDKEREKERERDRRREVKEQEEDNNDMDWRKNHYRGNLEEQRKRRQREREEDLADRLREEQELIEAKKCKIAEASNEAIEMEVDVDRQAGVASSKEGDFGAGSFPMNGEDSTRADSENDSDEHPKSQSVQSNGGYYSREGGEEQSANIMNENDQQLNSGSAPRKLGFGINLSGRRASVLSVFHQEDEEDTPKDRKLRPLVPIDYSVDELRAVPSNTKSSSVVSNLDANAEFTKSLSRTASPGKDDKKNEGERDKSRYSQPSDRSRRGREKELDRDLDRLKDLDREKLKAKEKEKERERDSKGREREHPALNVKPPENKNIFDAKQLIDTIPKTKEELFAYPVEWSIYDKHDLHERMRPWISKKITDFLGEEETTLVDFIVKNTRNHVTAANMLELLEAILDDEAEMFVLKMWRMLIFEIRRIETGLAFRPKS